MEAKWTQCEHNQARFFADNDKHWLAWCPECGASMGESAPKWLYPSNPAPTLAVLLDRIREHHFHKTALTNFTWQQIQDALIEESRAVLRGLGLEEKS
jgi:hypothetical protein